MKKLKPKVLPAIMNACFICAVSQNISINFDFWFLNELAITWFIIQTREAKMGADMHKFKSEDNV